MGRINKYLIAAIVLSAGAFLLSLLLFPEWGVSIASLFALAGLVIVGVVAFLANFRTMLQRSPEQETSTTNIDTGGGAHAVGPVTVQAGDNVGRDKITNIYEAQQTTFNPLHQLPPPVADFTGREDQLQELRDAVKNQGATISGALGMGGIGKTQLALKLADELKDDYPDAQILLDLKGASEQEPLTTAEAMQYVILSFEPAMQLPETAEQLQPIYFSILNGKRALLLMDNASDREQVEKLVPPASCLLLVTSRQHFTLPGMHTVDLQRMDSADAEELLRKIAPRIGENAGVIAKLCDYLPLALRLAGSALAEATDLTVEDYLEDLSDASTRLGFVEASLSLSYALLDDGLQEKWSALAVFPGSFDKAAAVAVWDSEEEQAKDPLGSLLRYSLLEFNSETMRYRLHDLAREYAFAQFIHIDEIDQHRLQLNHASHYFQILAISFRLYLKGSKSLLQGLALYDLEATNIQVGQSWAGKNIYSGDRSAEIAKNYSVFGAPFLDLRLLPEKRTSWHEVGLKAARELGDRDAEGSAIGNLGNAYADIGETREAIICYKQALQISRDVGNRRDESTALDNLGNASLDLEDIDNGKKYYELALEIAREIGARRQEGNSLNNLGLVHIKLSEFQRAIDYFEQHVAIAREIGDRRGEGTVLWNMALLKEKIGEQQEAIMLAQRALAIREEIEDPNTEKVRQQLERWRKQAG